MAAGVGPSSTVARQTPVRKHVAGSGALSRNLRPTRLGGFFSTPSRQVREFGPLTRHPLSACAFAPTPRGDDTTCDYRGSLITQRNRVSFSFKSPQPTVVVAGTNDRQRPMIGTQGRPRWGKRQFIIRRSLLINREPSISSGR